MVNVHNPQSKNGYVCGFDQADLTSKGGISLRQRDIKTHFLIRNSKLCEFSTPFLEALLVSEKQALHEIVVQRNKIKSLLESCC